MGPWELVRLFDYLYWMRDRILAQVAALPPGAFTSPDTVTTRDLRATLVHELDVEWSWRERLIRGRWPERSGLEPGRADPEPELDPSDFPTVETLAMHWRRDEAAMRTWLGGLTTDALAGPPSNEPDARFPLWVFGLHVVSHGVQQLREAAVLLSRAGRPPGDLEFLDYADERLVGPDSQARRT